MSGLIVLDSWPLFTAVIPSIQSEMIDPSWTPQRGYSHAENLLSIINRKDAMLDPSPATVANAIREEFEKQFPQAAVSELGTVKNGVYFLVVIERIPFNITVSAA